MGAINYGSSAIINLGIDTKFETEDEDLLEFYFDDLNKVIKIKLT